MFLRIFLAGAALMQGLCAAAQTTFYDNSLQKVEVWFSQPDWDYMLDTARLGDDGYLMADWVKINGVQIDSAGVKYKGNSSYDSTYIKNPVHIELDHFVDQSYQGVTDIKLSNGYADPSMIREVLAYDVLKNYMHCPRSNFVQLYINGNYIGLYSNDESINKEFCSDRFYSSQGTFFKCNPIVLPGPTTKSNLRYLSPDSSAYFNFYEIKSDEGWNDLVALCDSVTNHQSNFTSIFNQDRLLWMLAFNSLLVNLDSYNGVFCQNYYIYKDNTGRFNPIVWDLNMAFAGFPYAGSGNSSMGSMNIIQLQQMDPLMHVGDPYWPLINAALGTDPVLKRMYFAHMRTIADEMFASGDYISKAAQYQALIDTAVQSDANKFYSYAQFQNAMTTDHSVGNYSVPGISNLMTARLTYLQSYADYAAVPPAISNVQPDNSNPSLNMQVNITATITNASLSGAYLGYRGDPSENFIKVPMYDDGLHNDGASGDNVFGAAFLVSSASMQYYIYSENAVAGAFSPARAEHEFYTLNASIQQLNAGDVIINELMAQNQSTVTDANGEYEDWIELYNTTSAPLSLAGCYLSDDGFNQQKWSFPQSAVIPANGYLIIWADEDASQSGLHANFKLAASGEELYFGYGISALDSVTFAQQSADVSIGYCPSQPFQAMIPTFNAQNNCITGIAENDRAVLQVYPNPTSGVINIFSSDPISKIRITDLCSGKVLRKEAGLQKLHLILDLDLNAGIYLVEADRAKPVKVVVVK